MTSKRINARIEKWRLMIKEGLHKDKELLASRIRKGIPQAIRALAWPEIVGLRAFVRDKQTRYTYQKLINTPSKSIYDISLDIPRTFPEEEDSKVLRKSLNNVLKAISIVHPKVGYCQGMNFLALRLLQVLDDEETFWLLNFLLQTDPCLMKNFIDPKRIEEESQVFAELIKLYLPQINNRFASQHVVIQMFTVKWFMTLFSSTLKQELFYRIFEIYLNEGWKIIYATGLALLSIHQPQILRQSFEGIVFILNSQLFQIEDIDQFVGKLCAINIPQDALKQICIKARKGNELKEIRSSRGESVMWKSKLSQYNFPRPQTEPQHKVQFQHKAEQVTFQAFQLLRVLKK